MSKPVCAVIGGSGFLGLETVPVMMASHEVVATGARDHGGAYRVLDARDPDALRTFIADVKPSCVAMLAAYRDPDRCEGEPEETRRLNTRPLAVLAESLSADTHLVFVSTDYVFDGKNPPYREESTRCPVNVYGQSKVEAEDIVLARPRSAVLRVPLLMGWTADPRSSGFFSHLINDLKHDGPLALDDVLKRYPVWTRDAGEAIRTIIERQFEGIFHLSSTRPLTRFSAAREMGELLGWPVDHLSPSREIIPRRAERPADARLAIDKWTGLSLPQPHDFRDVARRFLEHFDLVPRLP